MGAGTKASAVVLDSAIAISATARVLEESFIVKSKVVQDII